MNANILRDAVDKVCTEEGKRIIKEVMSRRPKIISHSKLKTNGEKLKIAREVFEHIALQDDYAGMLAKNALEAMTNKEIEMNILTMKYFKMEEFLCKCGCGENNMKHPLLDKLDLARDIAEIPFYLNSAFRCKAHNILVGGTPDSSHLKGWAVDIAVQNSNARFKMLDALFAAGFVRMGIYKNFIHADCDPDKDREVIWHGSK